MTARPLAGRAGVVTGATSGIGEATAHALARAGARVLVAGRRAVRGEAVAAAIRAEGGEAVFHAADLRDPSAPAAMVEAALGAFGRLDLAFNNAGVFDRAHELHRYEDSAWDELLAVNLSAVFRCMRAELTAMLDGGGGVIVNNASTVGHRGSERASPAYVAAKHGVIGLTRQAAVQYAGRGVRVNAVSPGPTRTEVAGPLLAQGDAAVRAALAPLNPIGDFVTPDQVADAVVFLCSDAAAMVNGHDLALDGGQLAKL